jgi:hypothetical protein
LNVKKVHELRWLSATVERPGEGGSTGGCECTLDSFERIRGGSMKPPMEKGVNVKQKSSHDAFEWFVLNDSGALEQARNWPLWDQWRHAPGNKEKYIKTLELIEWLRELPPPAPASREELIQDAARDALYDEDVRTRSH